MDEKEMTGQEYPTIELGGKAYELKFTRGMIYRLDKMGIVFAPVIRQTGPNTTETTVKLSNLIDTLHVVIGFQGTSEELAELAFDKRDELTFKLTDAWRKVVLPSMQARAAAAQQRIAEAAEGSTPIVQ